MTRTGLHKIVSGSQMQAADRAAISSGQVTGNDLMERAADAICTWILAHYPDKASCYFGVLCGGGNNGGDGYAVAVRLHRAGYRVVVVALPNGSSPSKEFIQQQTLCINSGIDLIRFTNELTELPRACTVWLDAILGTGLNSAPRELAARAIALLNKTRKTILSVDVPSGVPDDLQMPVHETVRATHTLSLQLPKQGLVYQPWGEATGRLHVLDIGIEDSVLDTLQSTLLLYQSAWAASVVRHTRTFDHKATLGRALLVGGNALMPGCMALASGGALNGGAGYVFAATPQKVLPVLHAAHPEVIAIHTDDKRFLSEVPQWPSKVDAIGIGMGLGTSPNSGRVVKQGFTQLSNAKWVIDADALTLLATDRSLLNALPAQSILTPHTGEFERLCGKFNHDNEKWQKLADFARQTQAVVVLKGPFTSICDGTGTIYINEMASPLLARAGSGDVLTGLITGLLARGHQPLEAAMLGVYLHGAAAVRAEKQHSSYTFLPSHIANFLPSVYAELRA